MKEIKFSCLKKKFDWLEKAADAPSKSGPRVAAVSTVVHKKAVFCGISPLGAHVDDETREKIWNNLYVDIWSLFIVDQHTVDREQHIFTEKPLDRKRRVAKTMNIWLQAFAVLGCIMGQKQPERCSELFIYMDSVYSAYKKHSGPA